MWMQVKAAALFLPLAALLSGCTPSMPNVAPVRLANLANLASPVTFPLVIELQEGDRIPLYAAITGDLVSTEPSAQPPMVVVKRHFFLVISEGKMLVSLDGKTIARKTGSFRFGVGVDKEKGPKATLEMGANDVH
jgi:hypothetical protein